MIKLWVFSWNPSWIDLCQQMLVLGKKYFFLPGRQKLGGLFSEQFFIYFCYCRLICLNSKLFKIPIYWISEQLLGRQSGVFTVFFSLFRRAICKLFWLFDKVTDKLLLRTFFRERDCTSHNSVLRFFINYYRRVLYHFSERECLYDKERDPCFREHQTFLWYCTLKTKQHRRKHNIVLGFILPYYVEYDEKVLVSYYLRI